MALKPDCRTCQLSCEEVCLAQPTGEEVCADDEAVRLFAVDQQLIDNGKNRVEQVVEK